MTASWPQAADYPRDAAAEREMELVMAVTVGIRSARSQHGIPPGGKVDAVLVSDSVNRRVLEKNGDYMFTLGGLSGIRFDDVPPTGGYGMRVVVEGAEAYLSYESGVDPLEEIDRLARRLSKLEAELERSTAKLSSEGFTSKAPADVVEKERRKERELLDKRQKLNDQIAALKTQK
jgi:valyl-tRNA synthetase